MLRAVRQPASRTSPRAVSARLSNAALALGCSRMTWATAFPGHFRARGNSRSDANDDRLGATTFVWSEKGQLLSGTGNPVPPRLVIEASRDEIRNLVRETTANEVYPSTRPSSVSSDGTGAISNARPPWLRTLGR